MKKVEFKNLEKVFWPPRGGEKGVTKGDVLRYYERMASTILPYLKNRPENLNRHPDGIKGKSFFHKDLGKIAPRWAETVSIQLEEKKKTSHFLLCNNQDTLLWMANLGCIEINPWSSRVKHLDYPDYLIIDLDPGRATFDKVVDTALAVRDVLEKLSIESYVKTSGGTGLHILVPAGAKYTYEQIREFGELVATLVNNKVPEKTTLERGHKNTRRKVYLDYLQNGKGQTIASVYSLRPRPGATVSTPLKWSEVNKKLNPQDFTIKTIFKRLDRYGDFFQPVLGKGMNLKKALTLIEIAREEIQLSTEHEMMRGR